MTRGECVQTVWERDQSCRAEGLLPAPCRTWPGLDVHELRGGSYRRRLFKHPDACILVCPGHHAQIHADTPTAIELGLYWSEAQADAFLAGVGFESKIVHRSKGLTE